MSAIDWKQVCCPVDFSDPSRAALDVAVDLCKRFGARLTLFHVDDASPGAGTSAALAEWTSRVSEGGVPADAAHVAGDPQLAIVDFARTRGIDLIVMGTHGRTGRDHVLCGSVAETVVRRAHCPVLTVHGGGRAAPARA